MPLMQSLWTSLLLATFYAALKGVTASRQGCQPCDFAVRQQGPGGKLHIVHNPSPASQLQLPSPNIVWARYWDTYEDTGWDRIEISSLAAVPVPNSLKARAAGYAEGQIHADKIYNYWLNYRLNEFATSENQPTTALLDWIDDQDRFVRKRIQEYASVASETEDSSQNKLVQQQNGTSAVPQTGETGEDASGYAPSSRSQSTEHEDEDAEYWRLMGLVMDHFDGLCEGVWEAADPGRNLTYHELYLLQSVGDLYDLMVIFPQTDQPPAEDQSEPADSTADGSSSNQFVRATGGEQDSTVLDSQEVRTPLDRAVGEQRRAYRPGHGAVGPDSFVGGDMLECSALIKLQSQDAVSVTAAGRLGGLVQPQAAWQGLARGPGLQLPQLAGRKAAPRKTRQQHLVAEALRPLQTRPAAATAAAPLLKPPRNFWAGHATWRSYYAMARTWKVYQFPWSRTGPVTVSSSPGFVGYSKDDWYTTDKFVVMETTNGIYNYSLYDAITPNCALMWQRVQVANLGARSAAEWVRLFRKHNSGTYNNQWMVLDVDRLMKGHQDDVLWALEQVPGTTEAADVTPVLRRQGYWASYNVPYFPRIYNLTGHPPDKDLYRNSPRAQLFAREQAHVTSTQDMQALMRLNRYSTDPVSQGNPSWAIASRFDLEPKADVAANWTKRAFGAVDAKVVDWWAFTNQVTYVVNGPTNDDLPPFSWSQYCSDLDPTAASSASSLPMPGGTGPSSASKPRPGVCDSHTGLVDTFGFGWQGLQASLPWLPRRKARQ